MKKRNFDLGYRIDLFVENRVIIEIKSVSSKSGTFCAGNDLPEVIRMQNRIPD